MGVWDAMWRANRAVSAGTASAVGAAHHAAASGRVRRHSRGARRGWLAPGDPPPVSSAPGGYYDYRGLLDVRRVPPELQAASFPLGHFISPSRGLGDPIGLPDGVVEQHVTLVGPTGRGKTSGVVVPWMVAAVRAGWSVVAIDIKGDLLDRVTHECGSLGPRAAKLDYRDHKHSAHWNWLVEIDSERAVENAVVSILGRTAPKGADPYHYNSDCQILRGMLELVVASQRRTRLTTTMLLELLRDQDRLNDLVQRTVSQPARLRLKDLVDQDPYDYAKRISGVTTALDALARPMLESICTRTDFRVEELLEKPRLLSIVAPTQDGVTARMFSSLLVNQLLFRAYDRFGARAGVPLLLVLDEAATIQDRVDLEEILSVARAAGVAALIALQDVRQFKDENTRSVVFANSGTVICTPGVSSDTAQLLGKRLGQHPVPTMSTSHGPHIRGQSAGPTLSTSVSMVPVLGDREIMAPPFGEWTACVHARDLSTQPFFVDTTRSVP